MKKEIQISVILKLLYVFLNISFLQSKFLINNFETENYYKLPKFWTNTGFCPIGSTNTLLSEDVKIHLNLIASLPNNAISSIRVHWLLDLIKFKEFENHNIPQYDFQKLDKFLKWIDEAGLVIGFEFMGNPGIFNKTKNISNSYLWMDLSYQIAERYLEIFGINKLLKWKFESWNEPDLRTYNKLNFTTSEYLQYLKALRFGLNAASRRTPKTTTLQIRGPAGLFKNPSHHQLCWASLEICNEIPSKCPFNILTFHRKGNGTAEEVMIEEENLLLYIFKKYPNLKDFQISNNEADPIAGWSTPRPFQSDIRYAIEVVKIILLHWSAKLNKKVFHNFESISHDNAFLSYHPHEFDQRTLFAKFQMNNSQPVYSQFIAKPVYSALGLLGNLAEYAEDVDIRKNLMALTTRNKHKSKYIAAVILSTQHNSTTNLLLRIPLGVEIENANETFAFCLEVLESNKTDPVQIWNFYGKPSYPNATVRDLMRRAAIPKILEYGIIKPKQKIIKLNYLLKSPWIGMLRVCSSKMKEILKPLNLRILNITNGEVLILWKEIPRLERCIRNYEIYFLKKINRKFNKVWVCISKSWYIPFLSFQFRPIDGITTGYYKVRAVNLFGNFGDFSDTLYFRN